MAALKSFRFSDIIVYLRMSNGEYLNITDLNLMDTETCERCALPSDAPFAVCVFPFFDAERGLCEFTFDELLKLAGIGDKSFMNRFRGSFGNSNMECLAVLCAKKIADYTGGIIEKSGNNYLFYRKSSKRVDGVINKSLVLVANKKYVRY